MDIRGILIYLVIVFAAGIGAQFGMLHLDLIVYESATILHTLLFGLLMFVPAAAAIIAEMAGAKRFEGAPAVWPIPRGLAIRCAFAVPVIFLLFNGIAALVGWTQLDWRMGEAVNQIVNTMQENGTELRLPEEAMSIVPAILIVGGIIISGLLGVTVFALVAMGSEWGWRRFLLPRLLPLGKYPAFLLVGALQALWFAPVLWGAQAYLGEPAAFWGVMARMLVFGMVFSTVLGEVALRSRNAGLAAILLGSFVGQQQGIWDELFPSDTAPWTGPFGFVAIVVWAIVAAVPFLLTGRSQTAGPVEPVEPVGKAAR